MVFNATIFHNISVISWRSVLLVEETGVHNVVSSTSRHERDFFFFIELELTDKFYTRSWRDVLDTTLCTPVSSTNKTDRHDITEML
jgi:hypothetical protein